MPVRVHVDACGTVYINGRIEAYPVFTNRPIMRTYSVTYNANGGSGGYMDSDIPGGSLYTILSDAQTSVSRPGYTFVGWNTAPDGTGTPYAPGDTITLAQDLLLYAQWIAAPTFTVVYDANGGVGGYIDGGIQSGAMYTILTDAQASVSREGYVFLGWNTAPDGSGIWYAPGDITAVESNMVLYAQWEALAVYTVTYDANGGTGGYVDGDLPGGIQYTILTDAQAGVERDGYAFVGWNTAPDGSGTWYAPGDITTVESNMVLYAQWEALAVYTITYDANGGTGGHVDSDLPQGSEYVILTDDETGITRLGFAFMGWNTDRFGLGTAYAPGEIITVDQDILLYAQWVSLPLLSVTYDANGGTGGYVDTNVPGGEMYTILSAAQASVDYPGYSFIGWNTQPDGTGTFYVPGDTAVFDSDVVLYAQWTILLAYSVVYDANGGTGGFADENLQAGDAYTILSDSETSVQRNGFVFAGWNTQPDGSGTSYAPGDMIVIAGNMTLYAQWTPLPTYTVMYDANGGTGGFLDGGLISGSPYEILTDTAAFVERDGFTFMGWNTQSDGSGTSYMPGDSITIAGNVTLYAQWVLLPAYSVLYSANGGIGGGTILNILEGTVLQVRTQSEAGVTQIGFTFQNWNSEADGSGQTYLPGEDFTVMSNMTFYAMWA